MIKKLLMVLTNGFEPDVRVYKEAKYLVSIGLSVSIICWDRDCNENLPLDEIIDGIRIIRKRIKSKYGTGFKQLPRFVSFLKEVKKHIKQEEYDAYHCHDIDGAIIGFLIKTKSKRFVFDMHEFYEKKNAISRFFWRHLTIFLVKKSMFGLYTTDNYLSTKYKAISNKIFPLKNYPDHAMIQTLTKTNSNFFRIGYHGSLRNQIPHFFALFEATKNLTNVQIDINGGGIDYEKLKPLESKYPNVRINGPYNGITQSSKLYAETDLLFCPYDLSDPNYSNNTEVVKYFEAIITGTPILVTSGIGIAKKVEDNGFGVSCDTCNSKEILKCLNRFINDKSFWEKCHKNELLKKNDFTWESAVSILKEKYGV